MGRLSGEYRVHFQHPLRRVLPWVLLPPLLVLGGWGLYQAGYAVGSDFQISARDEARDLKRRVTTLERENRRLLQRNAHLERDQLIAAEAAERLRESVHDMESRYRAMEEELTFYRSIVSPENVESGLQIHSVTLEPSARGGEYVYRVVLTQIRGSGVVEGTMQLMVTGRQGGSTVELQGVDLGDVDEGHAFGFRYFQNLEGRIRVPSGVTPRSLRVLARTEGERPREVEQDLAWDAALTTKGRR
ncbi:hypothetical protein B1C78_00055 [Thioalkalivibrio denitrificans]|uniref:Uncharacterized protein n=1 Tax=Thioalkalivibrio denitrificans TaxID=108003 RepID=A0A1V3NUS8_9GAMM|nr:DUF6776 family protein [Thioalkalivibrio denitrificans]OOG28781.1 hypothetical protein B1C78_00055 [Thioalkalivibrio denitrificans]